jgi:repressor LexA
MNGPVTLPLTEKQKKVLQYIIDFFAEHNYPPTYPEITKKLNYKSPGHAYSVVKALKNKGYLTMAESTNHRSLRLTEISENMPTSRQLTLFEKNKHNHD